MTTILAPRRRSPIDALHTRLDRLDPGLDDLREGLETLVADRDALRVLLDRLRNDPAALERIAGDSYWHANGFAKLVLHVADGFRVRMHVWPEGAGRRGEPDPHSHRWDFASVVVAGAGLEIVEWGPGTGRDAVAFTRWDYDGTYLVARGAETLEVGSHTLVARGEVYTTDTGVVHTVRPHGDGLVATLVVQGPHRSSSNAVYRDAGDDEVTRAVTEGEIDAPQIAGLLERVGAALAPTLRDLGERRIVTDLLAPRYDHDESYGDDCASLGGDLVVTTDSCSDALVSALGRDDPYATGWLLVVMNLSDLAAAGAAVEGLVVNYTLPADTPVRWFEQLVSGVDDCAAAHGTRVRGGDLRDGPVRLLTATAIGRCGRRQTPDGPVPARLGRRGAQDGDRLLLVGSPGWLWASALAHRLDLPLAPDLRSTLYDRARRPRAELEAGRTLAGSGLVRASMDVSDGLYAAVSTLAAANRLGAVVRPEIDLDPVVAEVARAAGVGSLALGQMWGDWNLLIAVAPEHVAAVRELGVDVRDVGGLAAGGGVRVDGEPGPWAGVDQERFTDRSWSGDGIDPMIAHLRTISVRPDGERR